MAATKGSLVKSSWAKNIYWKIISFNMGDVWNSGIKKAPSYRLGAISQNHQIMDGPQRYTRSQASLPNFRVQMAVSDGFTQRNQRTTHSARCTHWKSDSDDSEEAALCSCIKSTLIMTAKSRKRFAGKQMGRAKSGIRSVHGAVQSLRSKEIQKLESSNGDLREKRGHYRALSF